MRQFWFISKREIIKTLRNKSEFILGILMGTLVMFVFGFFFQGDEIGGVSKWTILIPGSLATSAFMTSMFYSITVINDIAEGVMKEMIVAPVQRWKIAFGKILGALFQVIINVVIVFFVGYAFIYASAPEGANMAVYAYPVNALLPVVGISVLVGITMASVGLIAAAVVTNQRAFTYVTQLISMPFMFLSGAYLSFGSLPEWIRWVGLINPITYATYLNRTYMIDSDAVNTNLASSLEGIKGAIEAVKGEIANAPAADVLEGLLAKLDELNKAQVGIEMAQTQASNWFDITIMGIHINPVISWAVLAGLAIVSFGLAIVATSKLKGAKEYTGLVTF